MQLDLTDLFKHSDGICDFAPSAIIFEEGSPGDYLYVLLEGEVTAAKSPEIGTPTILSLP